MIFLKLCSTFGGLHFKKSSNIEEEKTKKKQPLLKFHSIHFSGRFRVYPEPSQVRRQGNYCKTKYIWIWKTDDPDYFIILINFKMVIVTKTNLMLSRKKNVFPQSSQMINTFQKRSFLIFVRSGLPTLTKAVHIAIA